MNNLDIPSKVKKGLRRFLKCVKNALGKDVQVYLFGSYARGNWLLDSDIDLVVVSRAFKEMDVGKRYLLVRSLLPKSMSFELLLYTPEEFEKVKDKSTVIEDAKEYWIRLA